MFDFHLFERLLALNVGISQPDNARALEMLAAAHSPLTVHRFASDREHNGWVIPREWRIERALIRRDGEALFDGRVHPLAVAGYSSSFSSTVTKDELDNHVFFSRAFPSAYAFHCIGNYRPWQRHWGFCIPYEQYREWPDGSYEVDLATEFRPGEMVVGEYVHKGESDDTIVFNAHTCHPYQANDDLSGVMVILELFKWLSERRTRYSYVGVLGPEHLGTVFYIADMPPERLAHLKLGCFLEMVGSQTPLVLQSSFGGDSVIDRAARFALRQVQPELEVARFREVVGNDETVWEAPGVEVPTVSISRYPYPEYHTSSDNLAIMSDARLEETLSALQALVEVLETDCTIQRRFTGLVALSNPKYDLYVERPDPIVGKGLSEIDLRFGRLQDYLPRFFDSRHSVFQVADRFGVPFDRLLAYLRRFEDKGLVVLEPVPSIDCYSSLGVSLPN